MSQVRKQSADQIRMEDPLTVDLATGRLQLAIDNNDFEIFASQLVMKRTNWSAAQFYKNKKLQHQSADNES